MRTARRSGAPRRRIRQIAGYALLEALVAVIVASVGFIGAAQTLGMKMNTSSQTRQKAVLLTYQMTDRIRANRVGFGAGNYNNPSIGAPACFTAGTACTPAEMAAADMTQWTADLAAQLPSGSGVVCVDSTPADGTAVAPACDNIGNLLVVKLWWTDSVGGSKFFTVLRP